MERGVSITLALHVRVEATMAVCRALFAVAAGRLKVLALFVEVPVESRKNNFAAASPASCTKRNRHVVVA